MPVRVIGDLKGFVKNLNNTSKHQASLRKEFGLVLRGLAGYIQAKKLSGQVLKVRENRLRGSIGYEITGNTTLRGVVGTEFGLYSVHETGKVIYGKPFLRFKLPSGEWIITRKVTIPPRPFMKPSLEENREKIAERLGKSIIRSMKITGVGSGR